MAFSHGEMVIIPLNVILIGLTSCIWWPYAPWWAIVPLALVALYFGVNKYGPMHIVLAVMIIVFILSIPVLKKKKLAKDAESPARPSSSLPKTLLDGMKPLSPAS